MELLYTKPSSPVPLPIQGLNIHFTKSTPTNHPPRPSVAAKRRRNDKLYAADRAQVKMQRSQVFDNSLLGVPAELYPQYKLYPAAADYVEYINPTSNLLVATPTAVFWAFDAAEIAQVMRRPLFAKELREWVRPTNSYAATWNAYLKTFSTRTIDTATDTQFTIQRNSTPVEIFDGFFKVICVCPTVHCAAVVLGVSDSQINDVMKSGKQLRESYYCRAFYDNTFVFAAKSHYNIEQLQNGEVVNRFNSIKDAAEIMEMPTYTIYRLLRNLQSTDKYGCTWRRNK